MASQPPYVPHAGRASTGQTTQRARSRRSELAIWWREIDRVLLVIVLALMAIGTAAVAAASPASARRLSTASVRLDDLYFFTIHLRWQVLGLIAMFFASLLSRESARRAGLLLGAAMLVALMLVPFAGFTINGARRWIWLGASLQPSEFLKPAFAICLAWILSWRVRDPHLPTIELATGLMAVIAAFLLIQPDLGSTILFVGVWFVMIMLSGMSFKKIGIAVGGLVALMVRVIRRMAGEEDLFTVLAATGLAAQLGGQAFINVLVNLQLFPSKGMTLPLISYGGSSTIALCLGIGLLLAITRRNPYLQREPRNLRGAGGKR